MALLDFREIASANRLYNAKQTLPIGISSSVDDFELFAQEFFTSIKKMKIFKSVSNGPDLGIDLGVTDASGLNWLVSCKHYAHMDKPVPAEKEIGIIEKTVNWDCQGFIAFYTTAPSTTLDQQLSGAEKFGIKVEKYTKDRIESELLASSIGTHIASRYFPKSMANHYQHLIHTLKEYHPDDVSIADGIARLKNTFTPLINDDPDHIKEARERLAYIANISATAYQHRPYFASAIRDAVELLPEHFQSNNKGAEYFSGFVPTWNSFKVGREKSLEKMYFTCAAWSFWDWHKANLCFAEAMAIRGYSHLGEITDRETLLSFVTAEEFRDDCEYQRKKGLLNIALLSLKFPENIRNIIGRLFIYGQTWRP
ncbi:hypothetical protein HX870_26600 [Pseudomonas gingeri]|uniref:hypothetical protein n=1 Tax=Pseudomonas gingeri TaxID=117681 RepID=UPI0015A00813|nr:hypothetical protein [Pseudomonas gingeri]NWD71173.1 hypothetical protein [Pseudomonas gingeri]